MRHWILLGVAVAIGASALLVVGKAQPSVNAAELDCSKGFPACGWISMTDLASPYYRVTQVGNGARFTLEPVANQAQFYLGWQTPDAFTSHAAAIYVRYHLTVHAPFVARGVGDVWTDKLIIVNNGAKESRHRAIAELKPISDPQLRDVSIGIQRNIDGGVTLTPRQDLKIGRRVAVQMEVRRGADGRTAVWIDNGNCARPTAVSGRFDFDMPAFSNVGIGFYVNAALAEGGSVDFTIEDVAVSEACDPAFK
jgi:hypothetical protein